MSTTNSEQIFTNKSYKIKTLVIKFLRLWGLVLLGTVFFAVKMVVSGKSTLADGLETSLVIVGVAALVALVYGAYSMFKIKNACVRIIKDEVDITVGTEHDVYPVEDYIGPHFSGSRSKMRRELVFVDEEDPESNIFYNLPVNNELFMEISDSILIRKHGKLGDIEYEAYEGDEYEGKLSDEADGNVKKMLGALVLFVVLAPVAYYAIFFKILHNPVKYIEAIEAGVFFWILAIIVLCFMWRLYQIETKETLKTLKFDSKELIINGREFNYKEIEEVKMTPPYLNFFSAVRRQISVKLYDAKKPVVFYIGTRLEDEKSEEPSENRTCIYPALYERVRTDRFIGSKFKV
ncbi:MAG: hypothetical protein IKZ42_08495 [Clostridiales bacterium]|nr:hypothetical protein [Clostridiales bacterium]